MILLVNGEPLGQERVRVLNHAIHGVNYCTVDKWYQNALNYPVESDYFIQLCKNYVFWHRY